MTKISQAKELGLSSEEYKKINLQLGRKPNITELGIFSAMWSEHCSYKSTKKWLKTLPTSAPWVIQGPGENAGVIDLGDGLAAVFKMESHNHPSFIEPYQGAATGVGGIMRDIFTMGARPIANLNCLRFGSPKHSKTRHLLSGVVSGIGDYGNSIGVPTIGGECTFDEGYNGNILVNAMTVGIVNKNNIFYAKAGSPNSPLVYVGAKTGRDGIHGASMASSSFNKDSENKRPTVQVGDPFTEKLLLEACLELMSTKCIIGIQDMGAAGLTSSSVEMAAKDDKGIFIDLDKVPVREENMTPFEIMLSESQERMLMVIHPGSEKKAAQIFKKWELDFNIIGKVTDTKNIVLKSNNKIVANIPIEPLANGLIYDRAHKKIQYSLDKIRINTKNNWKSSLTKLLNEPDLTSKEWIWEQYDHMVMGDTIGFPGSESGVIRIHGSNKAIAVTTDCTPRYCANNAELGACQAVVESYRNLCAVGSKPLAVTDCLNFGNPENPHVMRQIIDSIKGISLACKALSMPVVAGNVSLYNETEGESIPPTPQIGAVGIIKDVNKYVSNFPSEPNNQNIILLGDTKGHLSCSIYAQKIENINKGTPPPIELKKELKYGIFIQELCSEEFITSCRDLSDGGLGIALTELCLMSKIGCRIESQNSNIIAWLFGEDQSRYIITCTDINLNNIIEKARNKNISAEVIGRLVGKNFEVTEQSKKTDKISIDKLENIRNNWFKDYISIIN